MNKIFLAAIALGVAACKRYQLSSFGTSADF